MDVIDPDRPFGETWMRPAGTVAMIKEWHEQISKAYSPAVGRPRGELATPSLILDLDVAKANLRFMTERLKTLHAKLRPHIKVHKCAELARLQVEAGAVGVCTATVWEAIVMSRAGVADVLIANEVCGADKIRALARESRRGRLTVAVDDAKNCDELDQAVRAAGGRLDILVEVDVGMRRGGVRSADEAVTLAQHVSRLAGLRFRGVQGYEGHCMLEPDRDVRIAKARQAADDLDRVVDRLRRAGYPCEVVSMGGTGTYDITGADPRVTEIQAGSYVFMDMFHGSLVPGFARALFVLGGMVIRHGNTIVLDSGRKSISIDFVPPIMVPYPFYQARFFAEEHALFDVDDRCGLKRGDTVELVPGYAPSTVNLYDAYHVVEEGVVTQIWPVIPRGPGHVGILAGVSS
jgi:D-serine deaminase-like pyridoxal phosphate-dependent protein